MRTGFSTLFICKAKIVLTLGTKSATMRSVDKTVESLQAELELMRQALLSATGLMVQSTDEKVRSAGQVLYKGVKRGKVKP